LIRNKVPAIFKEDLEKLLQVLGELDSLKAGERFCCVCSKVITIDNIQLIIPREGNKFDYVCNDSNCVAGYQNKTI
jgi:hypothetical protein